MKKLDPRKWKFLTLSPDQLIVSPLNIRKSNIEVQLDVLKSTIDNFGGIAVPLIVRERPDGKYEIILGQRRWLAAIKLAQEKGLKMEIPCVVVDYDDIEAIIVSCLEDLQKFPIVDRDFGAAIKKLREAGLSYREIEAKLGISTSTRHYFESRLGSTPPAKLDTEEKKETKQATLETKTVTFVPEVKEDGKVVDPLAGLTIEERRLAEAELSTYSEEERESAIEQIKEKLRDLRWISPVPIPKDILEKFIFLASKKKSTWKYEFLKFIRKKAPEYLEEEGM